MPFWDRFFSTTPRASAPNVRSLTGPETFEVEAVGESNYQDALWRAVRNHEPYERGYRASARATLLPEPSNPYDKNAIQVLIEDRLVGYLSREEAIDYKSIVGDGISCDSLICGGFQTSSGRASLGVWLDLPVTHMPAIEQVRITGRSAQLGDDVPTHGLHQGKHYTEYVDDVKALKRHQAHEEALVLLGHLMDAVEEESAAEDSGVAPWYYEQTAIVCRKLRDFDGEVAVLERFAAQKHAPGATGPELLQRLEKARERQMRHSKAD